MERSAPLKRDTETAREFIRRNQQKSAVSLRESSRRSIRDSQKRRALKPPFNPFEYECWLKRFDPEHECEGLVVRCHLIKEQTLINSLGFTIVDAWHYDFWVPGCNGHGLAVGGHHFRLDHGLIKLDRRDLPARLERRASRDQRIAAQLDRVYGPLPMIGAVA